MYQPSLGRFLSRDPILADGPQILYPFPDMTTASASEFVGLYSYVSNNPINLVDPSGLGALEQICLKIVKALKGKTCNQLWSFCCHIGRHGDFGANGSKICFTLYDTVCPSGDEQLTNKILRDACDQLYRGR
jgi:RHS repeat-associated protein